MEAPVHADRSAVLEFELTPADFTAYIAGHNEHSELTVRTIRNLRWAIPIVFSIFIAVGGLDPFDWVYFLFALIWFAFAPAFMRRDMRKRAAKFAAQGVSRGYYGWHRLAVGPRGVTDSSEFSEATTSWRGIERVARTRENVLIYVGPNAAYIVPNRAFTSERELEQFVERIERGIAAAGGAA